MLFRSKAIGWSARARLATPTQERHPSWDAEKGRFFARLGELGFDYEKEVKPWCLANKRPKPSAMDGETRSKLLDFLASEQGKNALMKFLAGASK